MRYVPRCIPEWETEEESPSPSHKNTQGHFIDSPIRVKRLGLLLQRCGSLTYRPSVSIHRYVDDAVKSLLHFKSLVGSDTEKSAES